MRICIFVMKAVVSFQVLHRIQHFWIMYQFKVCTGGKIKTAYISSFNEPTRKPIFNSQLRLNGGWGNKPLGWERSSRGSMKIFMFRTV